MHSYEKKDQSAGDVPVSLHFKLLIRVKKLVSFLSLLLIFASGWSKQPMGYRFINTWHISDRFAVADTIPVDTVHINYQEANPIDRLSIANSFNGNLGSPIQSKLFFNRPANTDFIFSNAYSPYIMNVENATFYNTKTPYSNLTYTTGGTTYRAQDHVKFLFTANANKKLNFGTTLDYIYSIGEYDNQAVKRFTGSLFGSYNGKHYSATGLLVTNNLNNYENGGLSDPTYILNPVNAIKTQNLPINLDGFSNYKYKSFFYNQQYSIGFDRPIRITEDSVSMEYVPVTSFAHTIKLDEARKRYFESTPDTSFYENTYLPLQQTNDTSALQTLTNVFSVSMEEEFNKWMQFGLTAYVENEIQRFTYNQDTLVNRLTKSNSKLGGILSKERGQRIRYSVLGEMGLQGYKAGDFLLKANLGGYFKLWNDSISMVANGFIRSDEPSYFLQHYQSNHFRWDNNFAKIYRTNVGGTFSIPTRLFSLNVSVENVTKYVYFNSEALPTQFTGNIQVVAANLKQDFHLGKFALENNVVYQLSSQANVLPLPTLALFHNLYYHDKFFKVLSVQLGANVRYHTSYYAPAYMPASGQFHTQTLTKIGNYPVVNVYLNFHLKRTCFFVEYYHINQKFMNGAYFSMPNYPINPAILKLGLSWNFYN